MENSESVDQVIYILYTNVWAVNLWSDNSVDREGSFEWLRWSQQELEEYRLEPNKYEKWSYAHKKDLYNTEFIHRQFTKLVIFHFIFTDLLVGELCEGEWRGIGINQKVRREWRERGFRTWRALSKSGRDFSVSSKSTQHTPLSFHASYEFGKNANNESKIR
jgi:hypothetical protein